MEYLWLSECVNSLTHDDLKVVNGLLRRLSPNSPELCPEDLKQIGSTPGTYIALVRDQASHMLVGMARLTEVPMFVGSEGAIGDVVVDEKHTGHGIGKVLVQRLIKRASEVGLRRLFLVCWPENEAANRLYRSLGFEQLEVNYYRLKI